MSDVTPKRTATEVTEKAERQAQHAAAQERETARLAALGVTGATLVGAGAMAATTGAGPALLVLAGGALVGVVMLLWSSLRTLSGDAPLEPELALAMAAARVRGDGLAERKRIALRALKDLEHEHAVGKIDDADFQLLSEQLRDEAKAVMREMDLAIDDRRGRAAKLARAHLAARGLADGASPEAQAGTTKDAPVDAHADRPADQATSDRRECPKCATPNELDAAFCKSCGHTMKEAADAP